MNPVIIALVITQAANEFSKMDLEATLNRISAIN